MQAFEVLATLDRLRRFVRVEATKVFRVVVEVPRRRLHERFDLVGRQRVEGKAMTELRLHG